MKRRDTLDMTFNKDSMSVSDLKKVVGRFETLLLVYHRYVDNFDNDPHSAIDFFTTFGSHTQDIRTYTMVNRDEKEDV